MAQHAQSPQATSLCRRSRRLPLAMSTLIDSLERAQLRRVPAFDAGDRVRERRSARPEEVVERELLYGPEAERAEPEGTTGHGPEEPVAAADETGDAATAAADAATGSDQPAGSEENTEPEAQQRAEE